ncbi:MAG: c-type cytochrome, partial [Alphaproteobacteria bacterium]|nr:c-type cytochrome [Alphaproteobacteria bacterium]
ASAGTALADGERIFAQRCKICHAIEAEARSKTGPTLFGVYGRAAGAVEGFRYSPAHRDSGLVWDAETLDAYLADPQGVVPGTTKRLKGIADAAERAALIGFIESSNQGE